VGETIEKLDYELEAEVDAKLSITELAKKSSK
jgi:hypothetical protein